MNLQNGNRYVSNNNTFGPYVDGRTYDEGVIITPSARWVHKVNSFGGLTEVLVGTWCYASRLNGVVKATSDWIIGDELSPDEKAAAEAVVEKYGWDLKS